MGKISYSNVYSNIYIYGKAEKQGRDRYSRDVRNSIASDSDQIYIDV